MSFFISVIRQFVKTRFSGLPVLAWAIILALAGPVSSAAAETLSGRVLDSETNRPVRDVTVRLIGADRAVATDRHGAFDFRGLEPGTYRVIFSHIAYDRSDTLNVSVPFTGLVEIALQPAPWVLNDIVTTGTRSPHLLKNVPVQTEVVGRRDFQRTGAKTVDEALMSAIGIKIDEGGLAGASAQVRGFEGDRVLVLVDGERAVGRVRGAIDLGQYSLANVEKIEIVKGTGSTLYGSDAIGGVINIITRKPTASRLQGDFYFDYGSHTSYNPSAEMEFGAGGWAFTLGGRYFATDGFDLNASTPHTDGQDQVRRWNFHGKGRRKLSDRWSLTGAARYMHENRDWIESEVVAVSAIKDTTYIYDDEEINSRYEGSVRLEYLSGDEYSMKLRLYGTYYDHDFNKFGDGNWIDTSQTEDVFYEAAYSSNYVIGDAHVATYGFDYNYQDLNSEEIIEEKKADRSGAAYLQYEYAPVADVTVLPGVRYEHHSAFGGYVNPSFNLMYAPGEHVKLRGFVGRGFRAPSIKEQYFVFDHSAAGYIVYGGRVLGNDIEAETSINSSVSAEFSYGTIGLHRVTYFYNDLDNMIEFSLLDFGDEQDQYPRGRYVYGNVERAITQGVEWESRVRLSPAVDFSFSYNYLYSRNLNTGNKLVNRPDHTVKFFLTGFYDRYGVGASFWGNYESNKLWRARTNTGGNENADGEYAPHHTVLNLNLFKKFGGGFETFLRLENLLDQTNYRYGYWPGFQVFAGMKYEL